MSALIDKLAQRRVEGRPDLKVLGFAFAQQRRATPDEHARFHAAVDDAVEAAIHSPTLTEKP